MGEYGGIVEAYGCMSVWRMYNGTSRDKNLIANMTDEGRYFCPHNAMWYMGILEQEACILGMDE